MFASRLSPSAPRVVAAGFIFAIAWGFTARAQQAINNSFVGTTPCDAPVREFLGIPAKQDCERVRWDLQLLASHEAAKPGRVVVAAEYGIEGQASTKLKREADWKIAFGMDKRQEALTYVLDPDGARLALWEVTGEALYLLDSQRRPLLGNGGYSYSLSRATGEPQAAGDAAELSYTLQPLAPGPNVAGVFEGRTSCGMAQVFGMVVPPGCRKLKWRLTLFRDLEARTYTYRLEGSLFPTGAREGKAAPQIGTEVIPEAKVFRLEPPEGGRPVLIWPADNNVMLILDETGKPGPGSRDFGYALNRRNN